MTRNVAHHRLAASEVAAVEMLACRTSDYRSKDLSPFMQDCVANGNALPAPLHAWANQAVEADIGLLQGLPIGGDLPPTPDRKFAADTHPMPSDAVIGIISSLFGDIVTFEGKATLRQIHNVYPARDESHSQLGGSTSFLEWHVEDAFHPDRAEWLGILCLRSDPLVTTWIARARDLSLSAADWAQLRTQRMFLKVDESFEPPYCGCSFAGFAVAGSNDQPEIAFDPPYMEWVSPEDYALFQRLSAAADQAKLSFVLEAGDLLLLNNRRTIHARSSITPRFDGSDRWIKRALIAERKKPRHFAAPYVVAFPMSLDDFSLEP